MWLFSLLCLAADTEAPTVRQLSISPAVVGHPIEIRTSINDASAVFEPRLYFRRIGDFTYVEIEMVAEGNGVYLATIPLSFVTRNIEYFLSAMDVHGNGPGTDGNAENPKRIEVALKQAHPAVSETPAIAKTVPVYERWWFWTAIGAVIVTGATIGILCATQVGICVQARPAPVYDRVVVSVSGPDLRTGL